MISVFIREKPVGLWIDILPALCDYAGLKTEVHFTGKSLRPVIEDAKTDWRDFMVVELADYQPDSSRKGRMIRTPGYKYIVYSQGQDNEQFFNLRKDPGETPNLASDPLFKEILNRHRKYLEEW